MYGYVYIGQVFQKWSLSHCIARIEGFLAFVLIAMNSQPLGPLINQTWPEISVGQQLWMDFSLRSSSSSFSSSSFSTVSSKNTTFLLRIDWHECSQLLRSFSECLALCFLDNQVTYTLISPAYNANRYTSAYLLCIIQYSFVQNGKLEEGLIFNWNLTSEVSGRRR